MALVTRPEEDTGGPQHEALITERQRTYIVTDKCASSGSSARGMVTAAPSLLGELGIKVMFHFTLNVMPQRTVHRSIET